MSINLSNDLEVFKYLKEKESIGFNIYLDKNSLKYRSVKGVVNDSLLKEIKILKPIIVDYLLRAEDSTINLSKLQLAYLAGQSTNKLLSGVNAQYYIEYEKDVIDQRRLENIVNDLIFKNDILRMVILKSGHGLILDSVPKFNINSYEIMEMEDRLLARELLSYKTYHPETWPLFTILIGKYRNGKDVLHISFDCSILDAWSAGSLIYQIFENYDSGSMAPSESSYKEYMGKLKEFKNSAHIKMQLKIAEKHWREQVEYIPDGPKLRLKKPLEELIDYRFERKQFVLSKKKTIKVLNYGKENSITASSLVISLYMEALFRMVNYQSFTIITTMMGRLPLSSTRNNLIGEFTNVGPLTYKPTAESFPKKAKEVQKQIFKLLEYRFYDGIDITNMISKAHGEDKLFPVVVTCMLGEDYSSSTFGFKEVYSISQTPQIYLDHHIRMIDNRLCMSFDFVKDILFEEDIDELIKIYTALIDKLG